MQARTGIFTAAQVGVYDESKHRFMKTFGTGSKDVVTQFGASLISGLVTTTAVAPADIIKTKMFAGELMICIVWQVLRPGDMDC